MQTRLDTTQESTEEGRLLRVSGEVRIEDMEGLDADLARAVGIAVQIHGHALVLDLTRCWFSEEHALILFLTRLIEHSDRGVGLNVVARNGSLVKRFFEASRSIHRLPLHTDVVSALRALRSPEQRPYPEPSERALGRRQPLT